jgi:hypothetical protein
LIRSRELIGSSSGKQSHNHVGPLLGPSWTIEGEDPQRYEDLLERVGAAVQPIDLIDWLLVDDIVALTWQIQRLRLQRKKIMVDARRGSAEAILSQILEPPSSFRPYDPNETPSPATILAWE